MLRVVQNFESRVNHLEKTKGPQQLSETSKIYDPPDHITHSITSRRWRIIS